MTTDLERDLRHRLNTSADATGIDLDLDAILDEGTDRLRARTRRRTALAASVAALALLGGGLAAQSMHGSAPAPAHNPSSAVALVGSTATLDTMQVEAGEPWSLLVRVVAVQPDGAINLTVTPRNHAGTPLRAPVPVALAAGQSAAIVRGLPLCQFCMVGIVRGAAQSFVTVSPEAPAADAPSTGLMGTGPETLGGGSLSVMAEWERGDGPTPKPNGKQVARIADLVWRTADWAIHDSTGAVLPSVSFTSGGRHYVVYRSPRDRVVGLAEDSGWATWSESTLRKESPKTGFSGTQGGDSASMTLLPAGSTIQSAVWKHASSQDQTVKDLPGLGRVVLMTAKADNAKDIAELVRFTYRTKAGKLVTVKA